MWWRRGESEVNESGAGAPPSGPAIGPSIPVAGQAGRRASTLPPPPAPMPMTGGSFIIDGMGTILAFDRAMERLTGWDALEVVGRPKDLGFYDAPDEHGIRRYRPRPLFEGHLPRVDRSQRVRLALNRKDGARLEAEAVVSPLGPQSNRYSVEIQRIVARSAPLAAGTEPGIDPLTRLPNAQVFRARLEQAWAAARVSGRPLAMLLVDVDRFGKLNESYGREEGDRLLKKLAGILQATVRQTDLVARLQEDDFAILLESTGRGDARHVGGRIRKTVEQFTFAKPGGTGELRLTVSIGVSCWPADGESPAELLRRAREALDEAHRLGRNRVWCYVRRPRVSVQVPVYFDGPGGHLLGMSRDLSNSGVFVETSDNLQPGMRISLVFRLPGQAQPIRVAGRVARRVPAGEGVNPTPAGLGIEFERYSPKDRWRLESFLHRARMEEAREGEPAAT